MKPVPATPVRSLGHDGVSRTNGLLEYDESVDAAYLTVSDDEWAHQERLDDARGINYAADGSVIGIELLSPRRKGVVLDGLPFAADVARVLRSVGSFIAAAETAGCRLLFSEDLTDGRTYGSVTVQNPFWK